MADHELIIRCQRCGEPMEMKDPAPGEAWRPDQFWVCPRCGRHFWTTYAAPPGTPKEAPPPKPAPAKEAAAKEPPPGEAAPKAGGA